MEQVSVDDGIIAELPTLEACRHKAQSLNDQRVLEVRRQRLGAVAVVGLASAVIFSSAPLAAAITGVVGAAALIDLSLTWVDNSAVGSVRDLVQ